MKEPQGPKRATMTARDLLALLEMKHAEDLFIAECKNGPTQQASHMAQFMMTSRQRSKCQVTRRSASKNGIR